MFSICMDNNKFLSRKSIPFYSPVYQFMKLAIYLHASRGYELLKQVQFQ